MRWQDGYPVDTGSTNGQDSARLAGIMWVFDHHDAHVFDIYDYLGDDDYLRHPNEENVTPFSRDQASALFAGLYIKDLMYSFISVDPNYKTKNDIISPSVLGHFKRCAGLKANWFQDLWLWLDVLWSCFIAPMDESNQLICMMKVHENKAYLKFWCKWNKKWKNSILNYWSENEGAWRGEPELAELMIKTIESDVR